MRFKGIILNKLILSIFLFLFLHGCSEKDQVINETSFEALKIELVRIENNIVDPKRNIPLEKIADFKICLIDKAFEKPLSSGHFFEINYFDVKHKLQTKFDGCLYWSTKFTFDFFEKRNFIQSNLIITALEGHIGETSIETSLNLWKENKNALLDHRFSSLPPQNKMRELGNLTDQTGEDYNAYLTIRQPVRMNFIRRDFSLEDNLNLKIHRQYQMQIEPELVFYDELDGFQYNSRGLHRESFKLKLFWVPDVFVQNKNLDLSSIGSTHEGNVDFEDGLISDEKISFSLDFNSLPLLEYKAWLYIYLEPINPSLRIKPALFKIMFFPKAEELSEIPYKVKNKSMQRFSRLNWKSFEPRQKNFNNDYIKNIENKDLSSKNLKNHFSEKEINTLLKEPSKKPLSKLCDFIGLKGKKLINQCQKDPDKFINHKRIDRITKILNFNPHPRSTLGQISLNATFFKESSVRNLEKKGTSNYNDHYAETALDTSAGFSFFGTGGKFRGSGGWRHARKSYRAIELSSDKNYRNRFSYFEITNLNVETLSFNFRAIGKKCLVFAGKTTDNGAKEHLICKDEIEEAEYSDSWYYITQGDLFSSKVLYDHSADGELPWRKVIRGRKRYQNFRETLGNQGEISFLLVPEGPMVDPNEYLKNSYERFNRQSKFSPDSSIPLFVEL